VELGQTVLKVEMEAFRTEEQLANLLTIITVIPVIILSIKVIVEGVAETLAELDVAE